MKLLKKENKTNDHPFVIVAETKGYWFWKKEWAVYREWLYPLAGKEWTGRSLEGRHKTLEEAIEHQVTLVEAFYDKA